MTLTARELFNAIHPNIDMEKVWQNPEYDFDEFLMMHFGIKLDTPLESVTEENQTPIVWPFREIDPLT